MFRAEPRIKVNRQEVRVGLVNRSSLLVRETQRNVLRTYQRIAPKESGALVASAEVKAIRLARARMVEGGIRARARHARWVELGTGIWGPSGRRIVARRPGGFMRFYWKKAGVLMFRRSVAGQKPQRPMTRSLELVCRPPWVIRYFD